MPKTRGPRDNLPEEQLNEFATRVSNGKATVEEFIAILRMYPQDLRIRMFWAASTNTNYSAVFKYSVKNDGCLDIIAAVK